MKVKCPYCGEKISYGTRFMEKGEGEHICKKCKKPSNVEQNKKIWILFAITSIVSILILIFYFAFSSPVQKAFDDNGSFGFLVFMFFGKTKELKWILWELLPYIVFIFVSPVFVEYSMQKKYAGFTSTMEFSAEDFISPENISDVDNVSSTRVMSRIGTTKVSADHVFENISSSSTGDFDKTRSFNIKEEVTSINPEDYVKSESYRDNSPLKRVDRAPQTTKVQPRELYRARELREKEAREREILSENKASKPENKNYSANRKF